ncbi:MAG TPA: Ig-like domain-containing protein, partial [Pyrinomonadaceae bacterium]|nr:Ig-like domain-containing protein [Pyrinomonadaceae bacterium]
TGGHGVEGTDVTNFTFQNGFIDNSGSGLAAGASNLAFGTLGANNIDGVVSIINNTLTNAYYHGVFIENDSGTITNLDISTNTITSSTGGGTAVPCPVSAPARNPTTCTQGNGIHVIVRGGAAVTSNLNKATVTNNIISNFPVGGGIIMQGSNAAAGSPQLTFGIPNDVNNLVSVTGNRIAGASSANKMNTNAIQLGINGIARGNWEINNNGTIANPITNIGGNVISTSVLGTSTGTVKVNNNVIVANHTPNFGAPFGISAGVGRTFACCTDVATMTIVIDGNNVSKTDGNGIKIRGAEAQGTINARISNNTIAAPVATALREGIFIEAGGSTAGTDNDVCLDMFGNTTAGASDGFDTAPGIRLRKQGTSATVNAFGIEGMGATNSPGVEQYVGNGAGKNPGSANGTFGTNGVVLGSATSGFSNCSAAPLRYNPTEVSRVNEPVQNYNASSPMSFLGSQDVFALIFERSSESAPASVTTASAQPSWLSAEAAIAGLSTDSGDAVSLSQWPAKLMNSVAQFASSVDSLIVPTAHAETEKAEVRTPRSVVGNEITGARTPRGDIKLNHAQVRRSARPNNTAKENNGVSKDVANAVAMQPVAPMFVGGTFPINGTSPATGFTLPAGKSTTITFKVTVNNPPNFAGPTSNQVSQQGTLTGLVLTPASVVTDDTATGAPNDATLTTIDLFDTTTTLGSVPASPNTGQAVLYTATVASNPSGNPTAVGGTVTFKDNTVDIPGCVNKPVSSGTATCNVAAIGTGSHSVVAHYSGDGNFDPSQSSAVVQSVNKGGTSIALTFSTNPSKVTQNVTFTATVTANTPSSPALTGTVSFSSSLTGAITCDSGQALTAGVATCVTNDLIAGSHNITATYSGDTNFLGAGPTAMTGNPQVVNKTDTITTLGSAPNPATPTQLVTYTATVTFSDPNVTGPPTGTVTFTDGLSGVITCNTPANQTLNGSAIATCETSYPTTANSPHSVTATYNGNATFNVSTSAAVSQVISANATTTALVSSMNPSAPADTVTFTATVSATTGTPTGTVTFKDGATPISVACTNVPLTTIVGQQALCVAGPATFADGTHPITAEYTPATAVFSSNISNTVNQIVSSCSASVVVTNTNDDLLPGSLRSAISTVCEGGTITFDDSAFVAPGPYTIELTDANGELLVGKSMTITGPGASVLTVKRATAAATNFRVFEIAATKTVIISGMTISNGKVVGTDAASLSGLPGGAAFGGGILNAGTLTLQNAVVSDNHVTGGNGGSSTGAAGGAGGDAKGGGIYSSGTVTLTNTTVNGNNTATGGIGGNSDGANANGNGGAGLGGGVYSLGSTTLTLTNSTISGNAAVGGAAGTGGSGGGSVGSGSGGGVYNDGATAPATANITGSTISGNSATLNGGGIFNIGTGTNATLNITNSTISGNTANNDGGGIHNDGATGTTTLQSVTVTRNSADNDNNAAGTGGGINVVTGVVNLKNTLVAGNLKGSTILQVETATVLVPATVTTAGNAKVVVMAAGMTGSPKTVTVAVALADTAADVAGKMRTALGLDSDVNAFFTISGATDQIILTAKTVAANDATMNIETDNDTSVGLTPAPTSADTTPGRTASDIAGAITVAASASAFNLIGDADSSGGVTNGTDSNIVGVAGVGVRHITTILNSLLANNGGATNTHALVIGSAAIDSGDTALMTDQRGFPRPVNVDDIGAYERQAPTVTPGTPDLQAGSDSFGAGTAGTNTDNLTNVTPRVFDIGGVTTGATVELLRDTAIGGGSEAVVASGIASGSTISLSDTTALADGVYYYRARQTLGGDTSPISDLPALAVTIDALAPTANTPDLQAGSDSGINNDDRTKTTPRSFDIATAETGAAVELLRGGASIASTTGTGGTATLSDAVALADGPYLYASRLTDAAGNVATSSDLTVTMDNLAPATPGTPDLKATSDSGVDTDNITNITPRQFDVTFTAEAGSTIELLRDGVPVAGATTSGGSSPVTLTDNDVLTNNVYLYSARITDFTGNASTSLTLSVTIDVSSTPSTPDLQVGSDSGVSNTDNITKTTPRLFDVTNTENGATVELYRGATLVDTTTGNGGTKTLTDSATPADGPYDYTIKQTDVAGNVGTSGILQVTLDTLATAPGNPDLQTASDSGASSTDNRTGNATHSFDIGSESGALVELLRNGAFVSSTTAGGASVTLDDTASLPDTTYAYTARQTDLAGNVANSAGTLNVTIDTTAPTVLSSNRVESTPTNLQTVHFTVTFNEDVTGVDATDFVTTATGGLSGTSVTGVTPVTASQYTVTVDTGTGDGNLRLDVVTSSGTPVVDVMNIALATGFTTGEVYVVSKSDPFATAITRVESNPTNLGTVNFMVVFGKNVTGVDSTDFALAATGPTGASILLVTGANSIYNVQVNTGTLDGTLGLNLVDDDSIQDSGARKLGGTGLGNGNFTGEVFNIDKTKPNVGVAIASGQANPASGPTATTVIHFTATFNEPVTAFDAGDVQITGTAGATLASITEVAPLDGTTYDIGISGMTQTGTVIVQVLAGGALDAAGNTNNVSGTASVTYNKDDFSTLVVNTTADTDDLACAPIGTGNGCTLREAINAANADFGAETITFDATVFAAPGPYVINLTGALPNLSTDMTISGPGAKVLTVRRDTGGDYRIFTIPVGSNSVTIDGLTISNGNLTGSGASQSGGAIFNDTSGTLNIANCTISGNTIQAAGGAIYNADIGTLNITNTTISGNSALQSGGLESLAAGIVNITNSTISGNTADGASGGLGVANSTVTITNSTITNNRADNDNNASGVGGGIARSSGTVILRNTIVARNLKGNVNQVETATVAGTITGAGNAKVVVTAIGMGNTPKTLLVPVASGDTASVVAGKMRVALAADSDVNTFFTVSGAGANIILTVVTAGVNDTTMNIATDNATSSGLTASPTSADTTPGATAEDIFGSVDTVNSKFNLIGTGGAGGLINGTNDNQVGVADPGLFPLLDNGGPTRTHALQCVSVAIDKGSAFGSTNDQRGGTRPFDLADSVYPNASGAGADGSDIGAYETQSGGGCLPLAVPPAVDPTVTDEDTPVVITLTGTYSQNTPLTFAITQQPAHAPVLVPSSVTCNFTTVQTCTATVNYAPASNYFGPDAFKFTVSAGSGPGALTSDQADVNITVNAVNDVPVANSQSQTTAEDTPIPITLTGSDVESPITFSIVTGPAHGSFGATTAPNLTYTPDPDYNGPDSFTFKVNDGTVDSPVGTVTLTITAVNDPPVAVNDALSSVAEDSPTRTITIASLLANDSKGAANESVQTLTLALVAASEVGGTISRDAVNIYFTPTADFNGAASFQYTVTDNGTTSGGADPKTSGPGTVSFTITEVNDAPSTANDTLPDIAEDFGPRTILASTLTGNDSKGPANENGQTLIIKTVFNPVGGTVGIVSGDVVFTPTSNYNGPASFQYTVEDNGTTNGVADFKTGGPSIVQFNITDVNDPPTVVNDVLPNIVKNSPPRLILTTTLLANDIKGPENESGQTLTVKEVFNIEGGTVALVAGEIIFTPAPNYVGPAIFSYTIEDNGTTNGAPNPKTSLPGVVQFNITDNPSVLKFSSATYSVAEGAGFRTITVERSGDTSQAVTVDYASSDHSTPADSVPCNSGGPGVASSRCDFTTALGTLRFAAGETSKTFNVLITNDNYVEGPETLELTLSNPTNGAVFGVPQTSILTII